LKLTNGKQTSEKTKALVQARIQMQERVASLKQRLETTTIEYGSLRQEMSKNKREIHTLAKDEDKAEVNIANIRGYIQTMDASCDDQEHVVRSLLQSIEIGVARHKDAKGVASATSAQALKTDGVIKQVEAKLSEETSYALTLKRETLNAQRGVAKAMELQGDFENGYASTVSALQLLQQKQEAMNTRLAGTTASANLKRRELGQLQDEVRTLREAMARQGGVVMQLSREELRGTEIQSTIAYATNKADPVRGILTELSTLESNLQIGSATEWDRAGEKPSMHESGEVAMPVGMAPWEGSILASVEQMRGQLGERGGRSGGGGGVVGGGGRMAETLNIRASSWVNDRHDRLTAAREELTAALQRL
jgi:chromosome segregation ATPase